MRRHALLGVFVLFASRPLHGQGVQGIVTDATGAPVSGVIVTLMDSASHVVGRSLTTTKGEYGLAAPAGRYQVRTVRIGFAPTLSAIMNLADGEHARLNVTVSAVALRLDTVRTKGQSLCRLSSRDSIQAAWRVWDQVRAALTAGDLTLSSRSLTVTSAVQAREVSLRFDTLVSRTASISTDRVRMPWLTLPAAKARASGYIYADRDSVAFYAPGLDLIASDDFVEDHCFRLASRERGMLAIDFTPNRDRSRIPEIRGRASIDEKTGELRSLDFQYVNLPDDLGDQGRGEMRFARLANGTWVVTHWSLKMPILEQISPPGMPFKADIRHARFTGGDLLAVTTPAAGEASDTLWVHPPTTLFGMIVDSLSGDGIPDARVSIAGTSRSAVTDRKGRFSIAAVDPGDVQLQIHTPSLDSLNASTTYPTVALDSTPVTVKVISYRQVLAGLCGDKSAKSEAILLGTATLKGKPVANAAVRAGWLTSTGEPMLVQSRTMSNGGFVFCELPVNQSVSVEARADSATSQSTAVRLPSNRRYVRLDIALDSGRAPRASFAGRVLTDSTDRPIADAEVSILDVGLITSAGSNGAFRVLDIPAGDHKVRIRRIGYGAVDTVLHFAPGEALRRTIYLNRINELAPTYVIGRMRDPAMDDFYENRRIGLGHFFDRDQVAKFEGLRTIDLLSQAPGIVTMRGKGSQGWVGSNGRVGTIANGVVLLPSNVTADGATVMCFATVYVDGMMVYQQKHVDVEGRIHGIPVSSKAEPLFDINSISPDQIEAVEYYSGPGQIPPRYMGLNTQCGVLVIHTRRDYSQRLKEKKPPGR
jgi:hypothetical protein